MGIRDLLIETHSGQSLFKDKASIRCQGPGQALDGISRREQIGKLQSGAKMTRDKRREVNNQCLGVDLD